MALHQNRLMRLHHRKESRRRGFRQDTRILRVHDVPGYSWHSVGREGYSLRRSQWPNDPTGADKRRINGLK